MASRAGKQSKAHEKGVCLCDFKLTQPLKATTPGATCLAPLVGCRRLCGSRRDCAGGEALNGPEDDAGLLSSLGEDVVAVKRETVDVVAMHHRGAEVWVVECDGFVAAGGGGGEVRQDPEVDYMVHAATEKVTPGGVERNREDRFLVPFAGADECAGLPRVRGVDTPDADRGIGARARNQCLVDGRKEYFHYLVAMASEGLHNSTSLDIEDLNDACSAADREEGVAGGRAACPSCGAERFGLEGEVVVEVGEDFEASFGMRAGDDGFAAADDGEDGVNIRGSERVEVSTIVGGSRDSFRGLRGVRRGYGVWGGRGGGG